MMDRDPFRDRRRVRVRPGRAPSLLGGVVGILMALFACVAFGIMQPGGALGGPMGGGFFSLFPLIFVVVALALAALSFYNAFSERGAPFYEIDIEDRERQERSGEGSFCPSCGQPVAKDDRFCRNCGREL
jgi:hypothetical protein